MRLARAASCPQSLTIPRPTMAAPMDGIGSIPTFGPADGAGLRRARHVLQAARTSPTRPPSGSGHRMWPIIGIPFDDRVSHRPGARFGPRAIRQATSTSGGHSLALDVEPFRILDVIDTGDADIVPAWPERGHAVAYHRVLDVMSSGAVPIILGGDHSITWPVVSAVAQTVAPRRVGMIHFDAHADTADDELGVRAGHGTPMRRLIESGAVDGRALVQVGLRGYWPPPEVFDWMRAQGMRWHLMGEIEERGHRCRGGRRHRRGP